jgi:hypothetical protein
MDQQGCSKEIQGKRTGSERDECRLSYGACTSQRGDCIPDPLLSVFLIPSYGGNVGGYISTYDSDANLRESKSYYMKMNKNRKTPAWWIFEKDNILLLISGKVPHEIAGKYEHVLNNMSVE